VSETDVGSVTHVADRTTDRWLGLVGAAAAAAAIGVVTRTPSLLVVAGLGVALAAYGQLVSHPTPTLELTRTIDPVEPGVGEPATVELTVRNVGDRRLPDIRLVDGVPASLRVVDGTARVGTALRPGASRTITYEVAGGEGSCRFEPATVVCRDVAGLVERRVRVAADVNAITWTREIPETLLPVWPKTGYPGREPSDEGGEGVSFYSIREHRPGDPLKRVDWNRRAKTGEFATVEYRHRQAAAVELVVDTRHAAAVSPTDTADTAIERSAQAASALFEGFYEAGHQVGLAALPATACWLPPGRGRQHRTRGRQLLRHHRAFSATGTGAATGTCGDRLLSELPAAAHVVFLTPLCDHESYRLARRMHARGHPVTVVSPDPTAAGTPGQRLVALEREERLGKLRGAEIPTLDWQPDESFEQVAANARRSP
jgi:uncharacterized protein (DUF58 family)